MIRLFFLSLLMVAVTYAASITRDQTHVVRQLGDSRIVGGNPVSITKHPYQVSVQWRDWYQVLPSSFDHFCGGSVYSAQVVITAADCVRWSSSTQLRIIAGTDKRSGSGGVLVYVKTIIYHPNFGVGLTNNVAVLILRSELPIDNVNIKPIPLASKRPPVGVMAQVTGWGKTVEGGEFSEVLQEIEVPIISNDRCNELYWNGYYDMIYDQMMCAGYEDGSKDRCYGDNGGPLVVDGELAGINSWSVDRWSTGCARPGNPGVYNVVADLKEWIETTVNTQIPPVIEPYIDYY